MEAVDKRQLTLDVIQRKNTNYLPTVINFTNRAKKMECARFVGIDSEDEFDTFLGNHMKFTNQIDDIAANDKDDPHKLEMALQSGRTTLDKQTGILTNAWGLQFDLHATSYFNMGHPLAGVEEDIKILNRFVPPTTDDMDLLFTPAMEDVERYSKEFLLLLSGYNGVWEKSYEMVGIEEFSMLMYSDPDVAARIMDMVTDYKVEIAKETVRRGFAVGHHGDDLGTQISTIMSEEMFKSLVLPRIRRIFQVYKDAGRLVQMHSCGRITPFIPYLIDAGLDILEPVQPCMDIAFLKREYGKDLIFYGGVDTQELLAFKSPGEVKSETLRTIDILGRGGGYICAPAQEIMNNVPPENVAAMVEAVREAKGIPGRITACTGGRN